MSEGIFYIFEDQSVEEASHLMERTQIRRLPVLNRRKHLVGIVSLGDLATHAQPEVAGHVLQEISEPTEVR
jgi:CBS-domain-containing membrane protein